MKQETLHTSTINRIEDLIPIFVLVLMSILPLIEILGRLLWGSGIPGSIVLVQHLTLWIAVAGAMLAARSGRLLALSTQSFFPDRLGHPIKIITSALAAGITTCILLASLDHLQIERKAGEIVAWGIPVWVMILTMLCSMRRNHFCTP